MVFRIFYRIIYGFIANEQVIERLSQSYPIRRAAQLVSRVMIRGRHAIEDNLKNTTTQEFIQDVKHNTNGNRLSQFAERLRHEFRQQMDSAKDELKRRQR